MYPYNEKKRKVLCVMREGGRDVTKADLLALVLLHPVPSAGYALESILKGAV